MSRVPRQKREYTGPKWWLEEPEKPKVKAGELLDGFPRPSCAHQREHEPHFWRKDVEESLWVCGVCHPAVRPDAVIWKVEPHASGQAKLASLGHKS